jgi:arylsulfatase
MDGGAFQRSARRFRQDDHEVPSIKRFSGGASNNLIPNLQHPENPVPALDPNNMPKSLPTAQ